MEDHDSVSFHQGASIEFDRDRQLSRYALFFDIEKDLNEQVAVLYDVSMTIEFLEVILDKLLIYLLGFVGAC